ncbi:MAG TPA: cysteine desulfurase family protein [Bacillota bacterium]
MKQIYLDHAATTPVHREVVETMIPLFNEVFGNPSSAHAFGRTARKHLDEARRSIANSIHADEKEIIFTSGGTEADNLALIGTARANKDKGNHIITTEQEHHAILRTAQHLEEEGYQLTYLPIDERGKMSIHDLKAALTDETILVSVMSVNNETGVIQPISEIGHLLKDHQAYFHTDAVQAYGLMDIDVKKMGIDLLSASSHKINGPKGVGFLYAQGDVPLAPLHFGGEQERKRRPGTENVVAIAGFQKAVQLAVNRRTENSRLYEQYKQTFLAELEKNEIQFDVNGDLEQTVPSIVNISFPGVDVETMLTSFDLDGICASSGSACTAGSIEPSHVLLALYGPDDERTRNSIRFSFGVHNSMEDIVEAARRVAKIVTRLKK